MWGGVEREPGDEASTSLSHDIATETIHLSPQIVCVHLGREGGREGGKEAMQSNLAEVHSAKLHLFSSHPFNHHQL